MEALTYEEIYSMIQEMGFPAAYNHFPENTKKAPPFICFYFPSSNDFFADDYNYQKVEDLYIELYTANKDFAAEKAVETVLRERRQTYNRTETYLDDEKLYMNLYTLEVLINES